MSVAMAIEQQVGTLLDQHLPRQATPEDWDLEGLRNSVQRDFNTSVDPQSWLKQEPELSVEALRDPRGRPLGLPDCPLRNCRCLGGRP